jgi:glycine hydroxymethyltransferase
VPVFRTSQGATSSHQLAVVADQYGGGDAAAQRLRAANLLASAIGLPHASGLRLGTSEPTRWGMTPDTMVELASLIARALRDDPASVAAEVTALKRRHSTLHFMRT